MNEKIPDELLSASFDGELSPEDRLRVDAHLADDAQARRTRGEFEKLSELLHELPLPAAPAEFRAAVMQDIERQMLLGPAHAPAKPVRSGASAARRFRWAAGAVSLAAAAVLMVAFAVARRDFGVPEKSIADADFDGGVAVAHRDEDNARMLRESSVRLPESKPVPESALVRIEATTDARKSDAQKNAPSSAPAAPLSSTSMAGIAKPAQSGKTTVMSGRSQFEFRSNPSEAELGQVVEAWERSHGKVAVVRLTVLDRTQSVRGLQTILTRNSISEDVLAEAKEATKPAEAAAIGGGDPSPPSSAEFSEQAQPDGELIGVLVEASPDQLAQVLRQIQVDEQQEMSIDESIEVAELPAEFAQERLKSAESDLPSDEKDKKIDSSGVKEDFSRPDGNAASAPMKRESSKKDAVVRNKIGSLNKSNRSDAEKPSDTPEAPRIATQRQVNVPSRILNRMPAKDDAKSSEQSSEQKSDHLSDSTIADGLQRNPIVAARPSASSGELAGEEQLGSRKAGMKQGRAPVQVLFVFVNKPGQAVPSKAAAPIKAKVRREGSSPTKDDGAAS